MFLSLLFGGVTITLAPEATVRGTEIPLGAIATVEGDDTAAVQRVRELRLGYAPAPGYTRLLFAKRLASDVERMVAGLEFEVKGSATCRVAPATDRVLGTAIEAAARSEVMRWVEGREAELRIAASVADIEVPSGERAVELRGVLGDGIKKSGPINIAVRVLVDGNLYRTVWTNWRLDLWEEASVLKAPVRAGETIRVEMLEKKRVAWTGTGPDAALSAATALGAQAARDLPAGQALRESDLVRPMLVSRGDTLFLEVHRNNIHARVSALAEQDGRVGERIRVTLLESKRSLTATVVARDLAVIEL